MLEKIKDCNFKFHLSKWWFFHIKMEYLGHMIYLGALVVYKAIVKIIS
jgi:hypothetical protein